MSYLVIARKYRPATFADVVGQGHVTKTLSNAIASGRIAHAYLFSGPRGVGKTSIARIMAKSLNCVEGPTATPCGKCSICEGITKGSHVDVFEIDGASNTGVDNIREIRESVKYMPAEARYKIYIIDEVHMLSTGAFNALLKTLEEPPEHVKFIFATTETHKVPATISSRCQQFDFKRIVFKELEGHLRKITDAEKIKIDDKSLYLITREAEGSLRDAQSYLDQVIAFSGDNITEKDVVDALGIMDRSLLLDLVESISKGEGKECLAKVETIYGFGGDFKRVTADLLDIVRNMTVLKVTGTGESLDLPESEITRLGEINEGFTAESLQMVFSIFLKGYDDVGRSASPRYTFEMMVLRASMIGDIEPIQELINKVSRLKAIGGGAGNSASVAPVPAAPVSTPAPSSPRSVATPAPKKAEAPKEAPKKAPAPKPSGDIKNFLVSKKPAFKEHIGHFDISVDDNGLVTVTADSSEMTFLSMREKVFKELCTEFYGKDVTIKIVEGEVTAKHEPNGSDNKGEDKPKTSSKAPTSDTAVQDAVSILGGKVIDERRRDS